MPVDKKTVQNFRRKILRRTKEDQVSLGAGLNYATCSGGLDPVSARHLAKWPAFGYHRQS